MRRIKLEREHFGRLTVLNSLPSSKGHSMWLCRCQCGKIIEVRGSSLSSDHTLSCGCLNRDIVLKHGDSYTRLYKIWLSMKTRTTNVNGEYKYSLYGGRGIIVCSEWINDFMAFKNWALNNGYTGKLTIDRINVNGNYEPSNCRWATIKEQSNNKRSNVILEFNGRQQTVAQWSDEIGINRKTLQSRLGIHGWDIEKALTTPAKYRTPKKK